jgi:hypothetical protein
VGFDVFERPQARTCYSNLLAYLRTGRLGLKRNPTVESENVQQSLDDLRADYRVRAVDLVVGALPFCEADRLLPGHIFANLLSNVTSADFLSFDKLTVTMAGWERRRTPWSRESEKRKR